MPMEESPALPKLKPKSMLEVGSALSGHPEPIKKGALGVQVSLPQNLKPKLREREGTIKIPVKQQWADRNTWEHVHEHATVGAGGLPVQHLPKPEIKGKRTHTNKQAEDLIIVF